MGVFGAFGIGGYGFPYEKSKVSECRDDRSESISAFGPSQETPIALNEVPSSRGKPQPSCWEEDFEDAPKWPRTNFMFSSTLGCQGSVSAH